MKFFYLFKVGLFVTSLLFSSSAVAQIVAQTAPCPPIGIRTDTRIATNPSGQPNTFNWYYGNYQPGTYEGARYKLNSPAPGVGQDYLELPWLQPANSNMDRFQGKIDKPGDGWELIRRDLGYDDAGNPAKTTNPTLILYNRYNSMLRVFVAVGDLLTSYQLAEVKLTFGTAATYKAATLNRQTALGVALEDTEPGTNPSFIGIARYLNGRSKWLVADFPIDYDPCICQFDSRLAVDVSLISQANVQLIGKTNGTLVSAASGNSNTSTDFDKGIPFIRKVNSALSAGGTSYDNFDKFTNKLIGQNPDKSSALSSLNAASKAGSFLKAGLSALPYIGAAVSMLDYFMGGGQTAGPSPVVMQPMAIEMTTTTTGTITAPSLYITIPFHNPGNRLAVSIPENVPYYNEAMGVFSLLKKPVVERRTVGTVGQGDGSLLRTMAYRLPNDLQYVINPAAGLEVQDFQVALVAEGNTDGVTPRGEFNNFEGKIVQPGGLFTYAFRTNYQDAACIKNNEFTAEEPVKTGSASSEWRTNALYLKVMLNLRPINAAPSQQNVLFVARYPVTLSTVGSFAPLPLAACGVLPQASAATVQASCSSTKYKQAIVLARPDKATTALAGSDPTKVELQGFPNPTAGAVLLRYHVAQAGPVQLTLHDGLGRKVQTVLDLQQAAAGTFETPVDLHGLRAGVYYCTLHTASQHKVERIVVTE